MVRSIDERVCALCAEGRYNEATGLVLETYGGAIMRFLVSRAANPQLATEAFSTFQEDLCRGTPDFEFRASVRTWAYTLAYHALLRARRTVARRTRRESPVANVESNAAAVTHRSDTPAWMRTDVKKRLRCLTQQLPENEQLLLELRIARRFSWKDIARIQSSATASDLEVTKAAATLRKRFQIVREKLRHMAEQQGLLPPSEMS